MNNLYSYPNSNINSGFNSVNPYYNSPGNNGVYNKGTDERFIGGGFVFPFLLGGVTGAAVAPAFWRPPYNRPFYGPGPFYGPYRPY